MSALTYSDVSRRICFGTLCLLAFCIPIFKYGIQIPIILLVLAWLFMPKVKLKREFIPILIFASIYVFHLIGMLYTENIDRGNRDLVQKLSLILFPMILGTSAPIDSKQTRIVFRFFSLGTLVAVAFGYVSSIVDYTSGGTPSSFYMSEFSPVHHPSYLSFYMVIAIGFLLLEIERISGTGKTLQLWTGVFFLSLSLIFPASKMGFINFYLVMLVVLWKWIISRAKTGKLIPPLLVLGISFTLFLTFDPVTSFRIERAVDVTAGEHRDGSVSKVDGTSARIDAWKVSLTLLRENPFGYGTGDINDVLVQTFRENDLDQLADKELNPHNEFLQIALAQGLPAAIIFMYSLLFPLGRIIRRRDWLYGIFILSVLAQFSVESMLEKQSGVIFFAFFNALLFFRKE